MKKVSFITVTDRLCFAGTVVGIRSLLLHNKWVNPENITVGYNRKRMDELEANQLSVLKKMGVHVLTEEKFFTPGKKTGPWEFKTYLTYYKAKAGEALVLFDADLFFTRNIRPYVASDINVQGGLDGGPIQYDNTWNAYDFDVPTTNPHYLSSSCLILNVNKHVKKVLKRATEVTQKAAYNKSGPFKGHGDQGIFNACLFEYNQQNNDVITSRPLSNPLWSHHWTLDKDGFELDKKGLLVNSNAKDKPVYTFHCGGKFPKFWSEKFPRKCFTSEDFFWIGATFFNYLFDEMFDWPVKLERCLMSKQLHLLGGGLPFVSTFSPSLGYIHALLKNQFPDESPGKFLDLEEACDHSSTIVYSSQPMTGIVLSLLNKHDVTRYATNWPKSHPMERFIPNLTVKHINPRASTRISGMVECSLIEDSLTEEQIKTVMSKSKYVYALKDNYNKEDLPQVVAENENLWTIKN